MRRGGRSGADVRPAGGDVNGDLVRTLVRGVGQTLMTVGVVLLLFVFYTLYVTNLFAAHDQDRLADELTSRWAVPQAAQPAGPGEPPPGRPRRPRPPRPPAPLRRRSARRTPGSICPPSGAGRTTRWSRWRG